VLLSDAQVREACAMGCSPPWVLPQLGETQIDELRVEIMTCWLQSAMATSPAAIEAAVSSSGGGTVESHELRIPPAKILMLLNGHFDETPFDQREPARVRPRSLPQSLAAAGGPAALLMVVRHANDTRSLVLALRLVGHFLTLHPLNVRAPDDGRACSDDDL
jgi:hypothetical protein